MAEKVVANAGAQIDDAAITAGAAFELHARVEAWVKPSAGFARGPVAGEAGD